ncbi:MAG: NAD-dependent deacylase [Phycisphaerae bacterium]|nr:NAD-dependent deacylase [Phycisphaerae bacterium]
MSVDATAIRLLSAWLMEARRGVAFTGAGISTESGIPDFRSPGGVWSKTTPVYFQDFLADPDERQRYWEMRRLSVPSFLSAKPNAGHAVLAALESGGALCAVVTQNIDELHQRAGSRRVLEIHGTAMKVHCIECDKRWPCEVIQRRSELGETDFRCDECGGLLKSMTVSFGQEMLPGVWMEARQFARHADLMLAIGSSLVVYPAAELPQIARQHGARLVIINRDPTPFDEIADLVIHAGIGQTLTAVADQCGIQIPSC